MRALVVVVAIAVVAVATWIAYWRIGEIGRDPQAHQIERGVMSLVLGLGFVNAVARLFVEDA